MGGAEEDGRWGGGQEMRNGVEYYILACILTRVRKRKEEEGRSIAVGLPRTRRWVLFDNHAARQVLRVVFEELGGGSRAVGQLQLLQILQLNEA